MIQGRQKKNSKDKKERDFVAEATQAAIELEAELGLCNAFVQSVAIPMEYKDKSGYLCNGGRSVYTKMSDEKFKSSKNNVNAPF